MIAIAAALLIPASYSFPPGRTLTYEMSVTFEGALPLLGGEQAKAELRLGVRVEGLKPDDDGNVRASSELTSLKALLNDTPLPFELENVKAYFPKTTVSLSPQGRVLKTDAPDTKLPVRLPGLDLKRFPDVSYLPLEFPEGGIEEGKEWTFARRFGDTDMAYLCKAVAVSESEAKVEVRIEQRYTTLETEGMQEAADEESAFAKVSTALSGSGVIEFDLKRGIATKVSMDTEAISQVEELKGGKKSERRLKAKLSVKLASAGSDGARARSLQQRMASPANTDATCPSTMQINLPSGPTRTALASRPSGST